MVKNGPEPLRRAMVPALVALAAVSAAATASAAGPNRPVCEGRDAQSLASGVTIGANVVDQAWASVGENPDEVGAFQSRLQSALRSLIGATLRGGTSAFVQCRAQGLVDGVKARLKAIQDEVRVACLIDGVFWGELTAGLYCDLADAFGGVAFLDLEFPELQEATCGRAFESACQSEYTLFAEFFCPQYAVFPFASAFEENRQLSCTYVF